MMDSHKVVLKFANELWRTGNEELILKMNRENIGLAQWAILLADYIILAWSEVI